MTAPATRLFPKQVNRVPETKGLAQMGSVERQGFRIRGDFSQGGGIGLDECLEVDGVG